VLYAHRPGILRGRDGRHAVTRIGPCHTLLGRSQSPSRIRDCTFRYNRASPMKTGKTHRASSGAHVIIEREGEICRAVARR
jgi:hypothetical protein